MNKAGIALIVVMGTLLVLAIVRAWELWERLSGIHMGFHGWTAMILGAVASLALGVGLMFLVFYSHRKGYDEIERE
ncbi:MAG: hypothetical protein GC190_13920 [Alphaproteobacteria bacterium]|nr:hypothetical protein [Alphaproteobacteria bacterium]